MSATNTACVQMTGPDERMDHRGEARSSTNNLSAKCNHCSFPDLDYVAKPYLLAKGFASPAETSNARLGNFLVRERVRKILELAVPEACAFYTTAEYKSKKQLDWWLAVPAHTLKVPLPDPNPPLCPKCGEAKKWTWDHSEFWQRMHQFDTNGLDVFKTVAWRSPYTAEDNFAEGNKYREQHGLAPLRWSKEYPSIEPATHPERWTRMGIERELYFSVRLEQLLKRAKVKGQLVRLGYFDEQQPSAEDLIWIEDKFRLLESAGLVQSRAPSQRVSGSAKKWFQNFVKRNAGEAKDDQDFGRVEQKHGITLPSDYKEFVTKVGAKSFTDINEIEGFTVTVLPPSKLDFENYRHGKIPYIEGDEAEVDGVMFAETEHGDCFIFDVSSEAKNFPVYWYKHEENELEQFAPDFASCIKRFATRS